MPKRLTSYPAEEGAPGRAARSMVPVATLQRKPPCSVADEMPVTWPRSFTLAADVLAEVPDVRGSMRKISYRDSCAAGFARGALCAWATDATEAKRTRATVLTRDV